MRGSAETKWLFLHQRVQELLKAPVSHCVEWPHGRTLAGYGWVWDGETKRRVHRLSLALKLGRPPEQNALHKCDNPPCFNPAHVYDGSQSNNMVDAMTRGRFVHKRGPDHGRYIHGNRMKKETA